MVCPTLHRMVLVLLKHIPQQSKRQERSERPVPLRVLRSAAVGSLDGEAAYSVR